MVLLLLCCLSFQTVVENTNCKAAKPTAKGSKQITFDCTSLHSMLKDNRQPVFASFFTPNLPLKTLSLILTTRK